MSKSRLLSHLRLAKIPRDVSRKHQRHVKTIKKPQPGNLAHAEGHELHMIEVTTIHFECGCGKKLSKPPRK